MQIWGGREAQVFNVKDAMQRGLADTLYGDWGPIVRKTFYGRKKKYPQLPTLRLE